MKISIIGSGIAALGAAIRTRAQGHDVEVFEANDYPGGKLHAFNLGEYRFDGGPSLFTMPQFVLELFHLAGKNPNDYFEYKQSDEACRYFWTDGLRLNAKGSAEDFATEVESKVGFPSSELMDYFDHVKNIYDTSGKIFLEKPLHRASTWLSGETLKALIQIRKFDLFKSMHRANVIRLGEPHLVQLFDRFATYNGSHPYRAPGILNVIPWLEHGFGTFFPKGGMAQIPLSLHKLATEMGVQFHFDQKVEEIVVEKRKVRGIKTKDSTVECNTVISNMDVFLTYRKLLQNQKAPERILRQERSSSALVFYWGIKHSFPELGLHNIIFSDRYKEEFDTMFDSSDISNDPTVYINISSKMEPSDAPEGGENWFVMVNAPSNKGQDWAAIEQRVRKLVISKVSKILGRDIEPLIEEEKIWNPQGIEVDTLSYQGALYGNSSNNQFAAFLRHPNESSQIKGLYFCGGSVHPGGGIPLALLSGKITSELIAQDAQ